MRILVVGGAGYVGSHAVKRLVATEHEITVYDNLCAGHRAAIAPAARFVQGELADQEKLRALFAAGGFDAVMHFAAFLNVGESVTQPLKYYRNNVANTLGLLECMQEAGVKRIVFSGTCAVYGEPERLPIVEDLPKRPINPYGASKLSVEFMLADCAAAWGLGAVSLRYFNAAGAAADGSIGEDHDPEIHLIPLVLEVAQGRRERIRVFGDDYPTPDGTCVRDYIHVDDLAEAHLLAIEGLRRGAFDAFNVGTGRGNSVKEVIEACRRVTGHAIPAEVTARRPGDPPALFADPEKLKRTFGWSPRFVEIEETIRTAWQWQRSHPDGYGEE